MKKLNFLSKVCGLSRASQYCDVSVDRRLTVGSPSGLHRLTKYIAVMFLLLVVGVGNAWGTDANFTYNDLKGQGTSGSGSAFTGATKGDITMGGKGYGNTSYVQIYGSGTLTFTPLNGATITKIVLTGTSSTYIRSWNKSSGSISVSGSTATWTGSATSMVTLTNSASGQARITKMDVTYTAGATSHTLSSAVSPSASGSVSLSATSVAEGSTATATATPATHYVFDHWSISGTGSTLSSTTANPTTITMGTANTTVTANFVAASKASITLSEAGATTTDASTYYVGDSYTLPSSTGASCGTKVLVGWSTVEVAETNTKPTSNFYEKGETVTLAASQTFYAVFATSSGSGTSNATKVYSGANNADVQFSTGSNSSNNSLVTNDGYTTGKVNVKFAVLSGTNYSYYDGTVVRFYANNSITVTPLDGATITRVEIVRQSTTGSNSGVISVSGLTASNDNTTTNTNVFTGAATSAVTFTNKGQCRFTSISVTYSYNSTTYSAYATSCVAPTSFNVTYNANGDGAGGSTGTTGSVPTDATDYSSGATVTVLGKNTLAKAGHTFAGWNTAANGSGASYDEDDTFTITANVTLYAQWEINTYTVTWHVGDDDSNTSTVNYNTEFQDISVGKPSVDNDDLSSCESNYFVGWVTADGIHTTDGGTVSLYNDNKVNATDKITSDTHFYAMFATASGSSNSSSISSYQDGTYYLIDSHTYGGTTTYYSPTGTASGQISSVELTDVVSVTSGVLTLDLSSNLLTEDMQYTITAVAGTPTTYTIYNASTEKYIGASTSTSFTNTNTNKWELITEDKRFMFWYDQSTDRALLYQHSYNNSGTQTYGKRFGCYAKSNAGVTDAQSGKEQYGSGYFFLVPVSNTTYSDYRTGCPAATCGTPTSLTVGATVTKTGATISWTGSATGTLDHYEYAYWIDGEDEPTSGFTNNSKNTSATLSGLYSNVKYNWKVRQVCTGNDNSKWAKSYFTTSAANLTYSVPDGVSAVSTPATNASNLNTADVPTSCGSCWAFAGWTTAAYPDNSAAPANFFPAGTKARVSGDATLYAVYSRIEYKMIGSTSDLIANDNYVLTLETNTGDEYAMSNEAQETYTYEIARTDVTDLCHEYVDGFYVYNVGANNIWKFTGTASSGQLYNAAADKYINLSSTAGSTTSMLGTSDNLTFTTDGVYWTIYSTKYLHPYSASGGGWEAVESGSWDAAEDFSGYLYHQNDATYSTAPGCGTYSVTWKVEGDEYTTGTPTTSTNTCTGIETIPTDPGDDALGCADVFMGWSESELTGTGNSAPTDLFDYAGDAPDIDENIVFHAVFAKVASGSTSTTTHTMNNSGSINANWEKTNGRSQKADSYASKAAWQVFGYTSDSNPEGEINTTGTYTNVAGVTINVAASNATTVTLYYSANKSSWTEVSAVKVSANSSSYTDYSFKLSSMPKTAVYLKLLNSTNSLYIYEVKITTDNRTFNNYVTYCSNEFTTAGNWNTAANWSLGTVPTIKERAVIKKAAVVNTTGAKARSVVIYNDGSSNTGSLEISAGQALVVAETVHKTTNGSTYSATGENDIVFGSTLAAGTGALVMNGYTSGDNKATVNFAIKAKNDNDGWVNQFIGTPFNDQGAVLYNYYGTQLYAFHPGNDGSYDSGTSSAYDAWWSRLAETDGMDPFMGYNILCSKAESPILWMQGTLNASDNQTINGSKLVYNGTSNTENLLANSWMAPIHIEAFENGDFSNVEKTIYIFNAGSPEDYASAGAGAASATAAGQYIVLPIASAPWVSPTVTVIPAMQAFSVYATGASPSLTLDYNRLVYTPALTSVGVVPTRAPRRDKVAEDAPEVINLHVTAGSGYAANAYILGREDFADSFDDGWDGRFMEGDEAAPQLYAPTENGNLVINCVPNIEGTVVCFKRGSVDSEYTFTFDYNGTDSWYLNDEKEQESTLITPENTYTFATTTEDNAARFVISRTPIYKTPTGVEDNSQKSKVESRKMLIDGVLYIIRNGRMYDATGILCE